MMYCCDNHVLGSNMNLEYEAVIGLEVHVQLLTNSKMFCACRNEYGGIPNTNTCPICLALPGALPVVNREAIRMAMVLGLSVDGTINKRSEFFRKHYFYPDLPKGYQITQGPVAIVSDGYIRIIGDALVRGNSEPVTIKIERIHLEEDAGKSNHETGNNTSCVDLNRAGVPLLEIVSAPELKSGQEAYDYLKVVHKLVTFLDICDGNLEEGSFRCDANISVSKFGQPMGVRVEVKNINSFRFVKMAIDYEINRQITALTSGKSLLQETRGWDAELGETKRQRSKETTIDYCCFPEPNLPVLIITDKEIKDTYDSLPELPQAKFDRLMHQYELTNYEASMLLQSPAFADFFEIVAQNCPAKQAVNWMLGEVSRAINTIGTDIQKLGLNPYDLAELIGLVQDGTISLNMAKETVFPIMLTDNTSPLNIVTHLNLKQVSDHSQLKAIILEVIDCNPIQLKKYFDGRDNIKDFFVGQVMKRENGKVNPILVKSILEQVLKIRQGCD